MKDFFQKYGYLIAALLVAAIGAFIYFPSLYHSARADHLNYLADVARGESWYDFAIRWYDYNRVRLFGGLDALLFRPLFFFFMGNERALFGYDYFLWQLTGILLHAGVCVSLYRVLRLFHDRGWAVAGAGTFALLFINLEAVVWHHVSGYILFAFLVLTGLEQLFKYTRSPKVSAGRLAGIVLLLTAAVMTYEVGVWYVLSFFGYAFMCARDKKAGQMSFWLLVPLLLYAALSIFHAASVSFDITYVGGKQAFESLRPWDFLRNMGILLKWQVFSGFFLQEKDILIDARLAVPTDVFGWAWPFHVFDLYYSIGLALAGAWFCFFLRSWPFVVQQRGREMLLLGVMLLGYLAVIILGRMGPQGVGVLNNSLYYFYNFWALFILFIF